MINLKLAPLFFSLTIAFYSCSFCTRKDSPFESIQQSKVFSPSEIIPKAAFKVVGPFIIWILSAAKSVSFFTISYLQDTEIFKVKSVEEAIVATTLYRHTLRKERTNGGDEE